MTRRVLVPLLLLGLLAVCAIVVPVAEAIATSRTQQLTLQRTSAMDQIVTHARAAVARDGAGELERYLERFHDTYGEAVLVVDGAGQTVAAVGGLPGDDEVDRLVAAAARTVPQWSLPTVLPWSDASALVAEPLTTDDSSTAGAVVLAVDLTAARADVARGWLVVAAVAVVLLAALLAASLWWTRWVLRPVRSLDAAAHALAEQREPAPPAAGGPPELRRLTATFARMARGVADALEQQRGFVADASHQLRNPLAAIRLRVDTLPRRGDDADLEAVERDLDRLEHTVDRMLVLANAEHRATARASGRHLDAADDDEPAACVVSAAELAGPHRDALHAAGLRLEAAAGPGIHVPCRRSDLDEIVEILLDNARKYAGPGAIVRVALTCGDAGAALEVSDSGPGLDDADLARIGTRFWRSAAHRSHPGTGLGFAIVAQLARATRAELDVGRAAEGGLRVRLRWSAS